MSLGSPCAAVKETSGSRPRGTVVDAVPDALTASARRRRAVRDKAGGRDILSPNLAASIDGDHTLRSGAGIGVGAGETGVGTSLDGPLPGAMVIFSPLVSSGSDSLSFM